MDVVVEQEQTIEWGISFSNLWMLIGFLGLLVLLGFVAGFRVGRRTRSLELDEELEDKGARG